MKNRGNMKKNTNIFIKDRHLVMVRDIIKKHHPQCTVLAYGSRVDGNAKTVHDGSDLDLAIIDNKFDFVDIISLREDFSNSNIPFLVDVFDFNRLPESFQHEIMQKNYLLYDGSK